MYITMFISCILMDYAAFGCIMLPVADLVCKRESLLQIAVWVFAYYLLHFVQS